MDPISFVQPIGMPQLGSLSDSPAVLVVILALMAVMALEHLLRSGLGDDTPVGFDRLDGDRRDAE